MPKLSGGLPLPKIRWLEPQDFEFLCFDLAKELMTYQEPIPDYSTRDNSLLESALGAPKQTFDGDLLYPTLIAQATILFYSLIKNHPFRNGNKRVAVMALLVFLSLNRKWLSMKPLDLYQLAQTISKSDPKDRTKVVENIEKTIEESIENVNQSL